jgi:hypothetical protein
MASQASKPRNGIWMASARARLVAVLLAAAMVTGSLAETVLPVDGSAIGIQEQTVAAPETLSGSHQDSGHTQITTHCFFTCAPHMSAWSTTGPHDPPRSSERVSRPDHLAMTSRTIPPEPFPPKTPAWV